MNCLSNRAEVDVPEIPADPAPAKRPIPPIPTLPQAGLLDVVVDADVGETVGIVGTTGLGPTVLTVGSTLGTGTAGVEPTPKLPIS